MPTFCGPDSPAENLAAPRLRRCDRLGALCMWKGASGVRPGTVIAVNGPQEPEESSQAASPMSCSAPSEDGGMLS